VCGLVAMVYGASGGSGADCVVQYHGAPLKKYPKSTQNLTLAHKRKTQIIDNQ
jgi:hypothetical protein